MLSLREEREKYEKVSVFLLAFMLFFSTLSPVSAATATPTTPETSSTLAQTDMVEPNLVEVKTASGETTLINAAATSYPTDWVPMSQYNVATNNIYSKKQPGRHFQQL